MKGPIKYLIYLGVGAFFFIFFLFFTFPFDILKGQIIHQIEDGLGGQYRLKVQKMSAGLITGFTFKGLEVVKKQEGQDVLVLKSSRLKVNPSIFALIQKKMNASYSLLIGKGEIYGKFSDSTTQTAVEINFDEVSLSEFKLLSNPDGINLKGLIDGSYEMSLNKKDFSKNTGKMDLDLKNWVMEPYKIKMDPQNPETTMELPKINLTGGKGSHLKGTLSKNTFNISELKLQGGDVDANMKGNVQLTPLPENMTLDLSGKVKLSENVAKGIPILSLLEQQKNPDGSYDLQL
ncbi:MAG: type II secretion system protein GspN, partial [Deltaproteobacteria bacterium]|nr:type II secretion system protein GspN [Deltaproteobacteria bacterium]